MAQRSVRHRRLAAQLIARPAAAPADAVAALAAVQAQDYLASLWAVGLRCRRATEATIEQAVADGAIIRTHVFRGTLQYVARDDARWMLALVAPRVLAGMASRFRQLGLDERTLGRGVTVLRAATEGAQRTRAELAAALQRARIATDGQRLIHLIARAELDAAICSGARRGKQSTFAAFDERVPPAAARDRGAAIAELARRFFRSRGPATLRDFVWWTGLPVGDARAGLAAVEAELTAEDIDGVAYWSLPGPRTAAAPAAQLLPAFDEYLVGYTDRRDVLAADHARAINAGGGMLAPVVVVDGTVAGSWRRTRSAAGVALELRMLGRTSRGAHRAIADAAERYAAFLSAPLARLTVA